MSSTLRASWTRLVVMGSSCGSLPPIGRGVADDERHGIRTHRVLRAAPHLRPSATFIVSRVGAASEDGMNETSTTTDRLEASWAETLDRVRAFVATRVEDAALAADITQDV